MDKVYRNTAILIVFILLGVQWGFYQHYTSQFPNFKDKTNVIHLHGAFLMCWMLLLIIQPILIATGRNKLHKTIGKVSWVLGPLVILTLYLIGKGSFIRHSGEAPEKDLLADIVLDSRGFVSFAIFWALAMINRKNSASHMRYMIATGILAIGPGIGRGLINSFNMDFGLALTITDSIALVIVAILLGYDYMKKRNLKPFLVVFLVLLFGAFLWQIRNTDGWQHFAKKYAELMY